MDEYWRKRELVSCELTVFRNSDKALKPEEIYDVDKIPETSPYEKTEHNTK